MSKPRWPTGLVSVILASIRLTAILSILSHAWSNKLNCYRIQHKSSHNEEIEWSNRQFRRSEHGFESQNQTSEQWLWKYLILIFAKMISMFGLYYWQRVDLMILFEGQLKSPLMMDTSKITPSMPITENKQEGFYCFYLSIRQDRQLTYATISKLSWALSWGHTKQWYN